MRYAIVCQRFDLEAPLALAMARVMAPKGLEIVAFFTETDGPRADAVDACLREVGLTAAGLEAAPAAEAVEPFDRVIVLGEWLELPPGLAGGESVVRISLRADHADPLARARALREELRLVLGGLLARRLDAEVDPRTEAQRRERTAD